MKFIAYRFDCCPLILEDNKITATCEKTDAKANFHKRKEIINSFFGQGDRNYTLADGTHPTFKKGDDLTLRRYKAHRISGEKWIEQNAMRQKKAFFDEIIPKKQDYSDCQDDILMPEPPQSVAEDQVQKLPKSKHDTEYAARIIYHNDGVTIMRVQKRHKLIGENKQYNKVVYTDNYASALVVLVVRHQCQYIYIEAANKAFSTATLSLIMESTLNRLLIIDYHIIAQVRPVRKLNDFWKFIDDKKARGLGIKRLRFRFDYPNMPWPDDLLGGRFKKMGIDLNGKATVTLDALPGMSLNLDRKQGLRNEDVNSMGMYACDKGNVIVVTDTSGTSSKFGYGQSGDVDVELPDETAHPQTQSSLFEKDTDNSLSTSIILKTKEVRNMNQGMLSTT